MTEGRIFDIKKYSIHDGPGIRTTVFFKGCPLACWWCHNPESQSFSPQLVYRPERCIGCGECIAVCPNDAITYSAKGVYTFPERCGLCGLCADQCPTEARELLGRQVSAGEIMKEIQKDTLFYDESGGGATFSGGEPLSQPQFLLELLEECGRVGIHRAVDTTGYAATELVLEVAEKTELFLYDLKHMDSDEHTSMTGVSNELILDNLRILSQKGHGVNIRYPLIPGCNDSAEQLQQLSDFVKSLPCRHPISILPYHRAARDKYERLDMRYPMEDTPEPREHEVREAARRLSEQGLYVTIGG
ncbi:MAG: glycyl-radical enzyme activating protein [Synergistales bacterium]|nr:glycyl-radical enzyme activating protein [Synergistales bacterium]